MKSGWRCWKTRLAALAALAAALGTWVWWAARPNTPEALYRARCAACHALPDLGAYRREDMARIVETMRRRNGADRVIGEAEVGPIVEYMESLSVR